jgi:transposase-like protein
MRIKLPKNVRGIQVYQCDVCSRQFAVSDIVPVGVSKFPIHDYHICPSCLYDTDCTNGFSYIPTLVYDRPW